MSSCNPTRTNQELGNVYDIKAGGQYNNATDASSATFSLPVITLDFCQPGDDASDPQQHGIDGHGAERRRVHLDRHDRLCRGNSNPGNV